MHLSRWLRRPLHPLVLAHVHSLRLNTMGGFGFILLCSTPCHASYLVLLLPSHVGHANNLCDHSQPHINFINSPDNDVSCKFIYQGHEVNYMKYTISGELIHFLRASTSIIRWKFQLLHLSKSLRKNIQLYTVCI